MARKRVRWSAEMARDLVAKWVRSGVSASAFCRAEGLSQSSFDLWRRRIRGQGAKPVVTPAFVEIERVPSFVEDDAIETFEIETPNGFRVRFGRGFDVEDLGKVLSATQGVGGC